jgi:hypothetical protein
VHTANFHFNYAAPVRDTEPWNKAFSYSIAGHMVLFIFAVLMTMNRVRVPSTVLTEIKFVEKPVITAAKVEGAASSSQVKL